MPDSIISPGPRSFFKRKVFMNMARTETARSGFPGEPSPRMLFLAAPVPDGTPESPVRNPVRPPHRDSHEAALNTLRIGLRIFLSPEFRETGSVPSGFRSGENGREIPKLPEILTAPSGKPYFRDRSLPFFSWAHSGPLVFLGLAEVPLGTDAEMVSSGRNLRGISERFFSEKEQQYLNKDPAPVPERFFELWTLRESAGKFDGSGIQGFRNMEIDPEARRAAINGTALKAWSGSITFRDRIWYLGAALAAPESENTETPGPDISPPFLVISGEEPEQNTRGPYLRFWKIWTS